MSGRRVGTTKGAKKRADVAFSKIVRSRGFCEKCGSHDNLQCAHILSRRFSNTRCDEGNAFCLCAGCHHFFTDHPVAFGQWVLTMMSESEYDDLFRKAHDTQVPAADWEHIAGELKVRLAEQVAL